ncbi:MAG: hypothetical protein ABT940_11460 [Alphaproteobacteria bacterium]
MTAITFDTHAAVGELAEKRDIERVKRDIERLEAKIDTVRSDMRTEIANAKNEILRWMIPLFLAQMGLLVGLLVKLR